MIIRKSSFALFIKIGIIFIFVLLGNINLKAQRLPLKFSYLSVDNGLSHTDVTGVKQDELGFIWIATLLGLDRYDGYTIKKFYNNNQPKRFAFKNRIRSICLDDHNNIWINSEGGIQRFDPQSEKYTDFHYTKHNFDRTIFTKLLIKGNSLTAFVGNRLLLFTIRDSILTEIPLTYPKSVLFTDMVSDDSGNIWLSSNKGIWLLDYSLHIIQLDVKARSGISLHQFNRIFINRLGQLLIISDKTMVLIEKQDRVSVSSEKRTFRSLQYSTFPGSTNIMDIVQDKNLNYWLSTDAGLFVLDKTLRIKQHITTGSTANSLTTNNLANLLIDCSECLWVCTGEAIINICDLNTKPLYTIQHSSDPNSLSGNYIKSILEESGRKLWIGTASTGLDEYDLQTQKIKHYSKSSDPVKLEDNQINTLALDNDSNLWIGTEKGIQILNKSRNALWQPAGFKNFPHHSVSSLAKDCYGHIWFGSFNNGFGCIVRNKKNIYTIKDRETLPGHQIWADHTRPELFVSTVQGLLRLSIDSMGNVTKTFHYKANNAPYSLSSDYVYQIQKQNDSTYWIGTIGGNLDCLHLKKDNTYRIITYGNTYGIFKDVEALEFDDKDNLWLAGNGLERFNLKDKRITRFDKNDGLQGNSFKVGASGKDGRLYFGGVAGVNYFFPDSIKSNQIAARPVFTDLLINNKKVVIDSIRNDTDENVIGKSISYSKALHLNYRQNNFSISFSAMHYANPQKCRYRYKLVGFDKEWNSTNGNNPTASYTNLDYDDYSLIVQATNNDGVWSENKAVIAIAVTSPWWKSTLAKSIYLILFLFGLTAIYIYQARWFRLKRKLAIRHLEEKKQEELYQQQVKLNHQIQEKNNVLQEADEFKNTLVSILAHDFRSPLASTISIARLMRNNYEFEAEELESFYDDIENDAAKMLESFDTILQWIRQQLSGHQFNIEALRLHDLFSESVALFQIQLEAKKITFSNQIPEDIVITSDKEMLQFVNRNLLSNAIKFSPHGGVITAGCTRSAVEFRVSVADDGPGMSEDMLNRLFSISSQTGHSTKMGAGIALFMCRDFIKKLNGNIWAKNKEPHGAVLCYTLPVT